MKINDSDLFFTCSLIELIGRSTKQKRSAVVALLGEKMISHIYSNAGVLHCEPIAKNADAFIEMCHIPEGTFDNVTDCKYEVPDYWTIGKVFARLIEDVSSGDAIETLQEVYSSPVCDAISNYNSDFFYQPRGFIKEFYLEECKNTSEKRKTPALRFSGFSDAWEQRKLNDFVSEITRRDANSNAPVMMISAATGFIEQSEKYSSDNAGQSLAKYTILRRGELAYNHGASKYRKYGSCFALLVDEARVPFVYHCFEVGANNPCFVATVLNVPQIDYQLRKLVSSGARMDGLLNISFEAYKTVQICLPQKAEQDKVSLFLMSLDRLITLHQRKYDKLTKVKKSMLEKMFPKNGSDVPEIRFSGFSDAWEQRKVREVTEDYVEKTVIQNQYPVLTSSQQQGIVLQEKYFADRQVTTSENIGYFVLPRGFFTYRSRSDTDVFVFNRNMLIDKGIISKYYPVFSAKDTVPEFLLRRLNFGIRKQLSMAAEGTGQKVLAHSKFKDMVIVIPEPREQEKIGAFFESLDRLITLHQRERLFLILEEILC